jgi:hypothetical protein
MYLANSTRLDIAFVVNMFARYTMLLLTSIIGLDLNVFRYLNGTKDLGLFFNRNDDKTRIGYVDVGYLSDPHDAKSRIGFIFMHGGTTISWKSSNQTMVATSTNHSKIITLFEASLSVYGFAEWYTT